MKAAKGVKALRLADGSASLLSEAEKIRQIAKYFRSIMEVLGLDPEAEGLCRTPERVAKMYVQELFKGLDSASRPNFRHFKNSYGYTDMVVEQDISFFSCCEHHFAPFFGKVHIGYFPRERIIGLSKLNRLVHYHARRPQIQERLTVAIGREMEEVLETKDVGVMVYATHLCVISRGVSDVGSKTCTGYFSGKFEEEAIKERFRGQLRD